MLDQESANVPEAASSPEADLAPTSAKPQATNRKSLGSILREFFLMTEAAAHARAHDFTPKDPGFAEYQAATRCLEAAESLGDGARSGIEGISLLREALLLLLEAFRARRGMGLAEGLPELWATFIDHPEGAQLAAGISEDDRAAVARLLGPRSVLEVVPAPRPTRLQLSRGLTSVVAKLAERLETEARGILRVQVARILRCFGLPLATAAVVAGTVWLLTPAPVNIAFNKPVQLSTSYRPEMYPPAALVNGDKDTLAIHTVDENQPWAQIDLGREYEIHRVVVTNREDNQERAVPLQISTSLDGKTTTPFALQDQPFKTWEAKGTPVRARYVRLTVMRLSALHLNEVEVY